MFTPLANRKRIARTGAEPRAKGCVYPAPEKTSLLPPRAVYYQEKFLRTISKLNITKRSKCTPIAGIFALFQYWKMFFRQSVLGRFCANQSVSP